MRRGHHVQNSVVRLIVGNAEWRQRLAHQFDLAVCPHPAIRRDLHFQFWWRRSAADRLGHGGAGVIGVGVPDVGPVQRPNEAHGYTLTSRRGASHLSSLDLPLDASSCTHPPARRLRGRGRRCGDEDSCKQSNSAPGKNRAEPTFEGATDDAGRPAYIQAITLRPGRAA